MNIFESKSASRDLGATLGATLFVLSQNIAGFSKPPPTAMIAFCGPERVQRPTGLIPEEGESSRNICKAPLLRLSTTVAGRAIHQPTVTNLLIM